MVAEYGQPGNLYVRLIMLLRKLTVSMDNFLHLVHHFESALCDTCYIP